ncbi:MAG: M48 family metallopeptidase [Pyrinomonadaceae bacterium]
MTMKKSRSTRPLFLALLTLTLSTLAFAVSPQEPPRVEWTPPAPREKAKTPFAPEPFGGDNIFKGEAESWLADAITKVEAGRLEPVEDKFVADYVAQLGQRLAAYSVAPSKQYRFIVLYDNEVNAMSIGGGRIYVNLGMLKNVESEDELACVIAHEIGHDAFGHAPKTVTRQLFWMTGVRKVRNYEEVESSLEKLLDEYGKKPVAAIGESLLGFSRFNELEADRAAFYDAYKAGYNPEALKTVFKRFEREEKAEAGKDYAMSQFMTLLFGSHPPTPQRETAISWESNFVKMPPKGERYKSAAFDAMKARVSKL